MPCTSSAVEHFEKEGVLYAPGKASNAGGVAVSWLEMVQNRSGLSWEEEEVRCCAPPCAARAARLASSMLLDTGAAGAAGHWRCVCASVC
jgi:hypothetical protein